jgi:hypothetical protein
VPCSHPETSLYDDRKRVKRIGDLYNRIIYAVFIEKKQQQSKKNVILIIF